MKIQSNYIIMKPIQLPWLYVSPLDIKGLEYHLSPDLSIRLEGIISGDMDFVISHIVLGIEGIEANELQAEQMFLNEFLPNKSKERVMRSFKDDISCFFSVKQMEYLQKLFEEKNFMSYSVSVFYKDKKVEDIAALPPKEFKLVSTAFDDLDVQWAFSHKINKEEIEETYNEGYKQNIAALEQKEKKSLWEKVQNKGVMKKLAMAVGSIAIGIGGMLARSRLANKGGAAGVVLALLLGTGGVVMELYGRSETESLLKQLKPNDRAERMAFI